MELSTTLRAYTLRFFGCELAFMGLFLANGRSYYGFIVCYIFLCSHELRTPMAAVIGLLDILLCDECLSSEQVNMVSQIRRCSTALLRLLNNILDISKVLFKKFITFDLALVLKCRNRMRILPRCVLLVSVNDGRR